jgi:hypothetical protein
MGKRRVWRHVLALAGVATTLPATAPASHLDGVVWTFESGTSLSAFPGFTLNGAPITRTGTSGWSGRFLGAFGEETLHFDAIDYLGSISLLTRRAYLSFDLLVNHSWSGNYPGLESLFAVTANGATVLNTSFGFGGTQSYPGSHPEDSFPGGTGRVFNEPGSRGYDVYHFNGVFPMNPFYPDCCTDVSFAFAASFGPDFDELIEEFPEFAPTWGIDNFVVSSTPIPEPATGGLLGLGLLALGGARRLSRRGAAPRRSHPHARRCR